MQKDYYLLFIYQDVEPKLFGPFETEKLLDKKAKQLRNDYGDTAGYFPVEISKNSKINISCYSGSFFEG